MQQPFPINEPEKADPLRDDLFGHGHGFDREKPPDLDKAWKNFNNRLNRLFRWGKKKKGNDPQEPQDEDEDPFNDRENGTKGLKMALCILFGVAAVFWLGTGFFVVPEGQTGIVMTFGRFSHFASPGYNWRKPWPIENHEVVNVSQIRNVELGYRNSLKNKQAQEALMLTNDGNIVDMQAVLQYRLKDAADWAFNNRDQEEMIRQLAEAVMHEIVANRKMDFVLYEGRDQIAAEAQKKMQEIFDQYRSGVQVIGVTIQDVQPPAQVQAAFDDAVKAGQDRERLKEEGKAYANEVIPKAQGAAARLKAEAEGYKERVIANAEGDAIRFKHVVAEYQKAPAVTRDRMYLETMQQIFSNTTKLLVDTKKGNQLLYLPLEKLVSQTAKSSESSSDKDTPDSASDVSEASKKDHPEASRGREDRSRGGR